MATCVDYCIIPVQIRQNEYGLVTFNGEIPHFDNEYHFWQVCEPVNRAAMDALNLSLTTSRCLTVDRLPDAPDLRLYNVYLMHHNSDQVPQHVAALDDIAWDALPFTRADVEGWLNWLTNDHINRRLWYRREWIDQLQSLIPQGASITQLRSWERSAIYRLDFADAPQQYLKMIPPMFAHEPALTRWLHHRYPTQIPSPLICSTAVP